MRTYSSFCGTVCSDSTGTVTSDAAVRLHRRYQNSSSENQSIIMLWKQVSRIICLSKWICILCFDDQVYKLDYNITILISQFN